MCRRCGIVGVNKHVWLIEKKDKLASGGIDCDFRRISFYRHFSGSIPHGSPYVLQSAFGLTQHDIL